MHQRLSRSSGLVVACLGGLLLGAALLVAYLVRHGTGACDVSEPMPSHELLVNAAIVVAVTDIVLCAASWYPLRETDRSEWPALIGAAAAVLLLACLVVKYGALHGGC